MSLLLVCRLNVSGLVISPEQATPRAGMIIILTWQVAVSGHAGRGSAMSGVRVLVGTRKGAFVLTSDGKREQWEVSGPHFAGWEIYHLKGSPVDPNRLYASQSQRLVRAGDPALRRRRQDVGAGRQQVRLRWRPRHAPVVRRHAASLGVQARLASRTLADRSGHRLRRRGGCRACSARPTAGRPGRSCRAARPRLGPRWQPGAGGMCLHTILLDPSDPQRIFIAISAAGAFRTDDGGQDVAADQPRAAVRIHPRPDAEVGHCVHRIAMHPRARTCCSCRSTGT